MPHTFVFDVLVDLIAPVRARAGQVLVVRGDAVAVVRRGSTTPLSDGAITAFDLTALIARGAVRRRSTESRQRTG
jgi:hypothetical protein